MRRLIILAAIVSVLALSGAAINPLSAQDAKPAAANNFLSLPASSFLEVRDDYDFWRSQALWTNVGDGSFYAPVNLPHGATIKKIMLICKDNSSGLNIDVGLYRLSRSHVETGLLNIGEISSSGNMTTWRMFATADISPRKVNNFKFSYYVSLWMEGPKSAGLEFSQVKIFFNDPL